MKLNKAGWESDKISVVDGRNERTRAIDTEIAAHAAMWFQAHDTCEPKKPSELKREDGLRLVKKFGIAVCTRQGVRRRSGRSVPNTSAEICGYLLIVKNGEKLPMCRGCHKRVWVRNEEVIFQHDVVEIVETVISAIMGWKGRGRTIDRLPVAKMGEWAKRAEGRLEDRAEVVAFYNRLPWNLPNFGVKL